MLLTSIVNCYALSNFKRRSRKLQHNLTQIPRRNILQYISLLWIDILHHVRLIKPDIPQCGTPR